jgi:hypothetical protein
MRTWARPEHPVVCLIGGSALIRQAVRATAVKRGSLHIPVALSEATVGARHPAGGVRMGHFQVSYWYSLLAAMMPVILV